MTATTLLQTLLWAALSAAGFAMIFNVPRRTLLGCVLGAAIGITTRNILTQQFQWTAELATLAGATSVGLLSQLFARRWRSPALVFAIPAVIMMVPGSFAFRTMINLLEITNQGTFTGTPTVVEAIVNFVKTGLILLAIATGIAVPSLAFNWHHK